MSVRVPHLHVRVRSVCGLDYSFNHDRCGHVENPLSAIFARERGSNDAGTVPAVLSFVVLENDGGFVVLRPKVTVAPSI